MSKLWPFEEQVPAQADIRKPEVDIQPAILQLKRNVFYVLPARLSEGPTCSEQAYFAYFNFRTSHLDVVNATLLFGQGFKKLSYPTKFPLNFSRLRMILTMYCETASMDRFEALVQIDPPHCHVQLLVLSKTRTYGNLLLSGTSLERFNPLSSLSQCSDRISKQLPWGDILSVAIEVTLFQGQREYCVDVSMNKPGWAMFQPQHQGPWLTAADSNEIGKLWLHAGK